MLLKSKKFLIPLKQKYRGDNVVDFDIDLNIKLNKLIQTSNSVWERIRKRTFELVVEDLALEIDQEWGPEYTRVVTKVLTAVRKTTRDYAVKDRIKQIVSFYILNPLNLLKLS